MSRMRVGQVAHCRWYGTLHVFKSRRVGAVRSLFKRKRYRAAMNYNPQGKLGGSVEPPCDFQKQSSVCPVFIGIPP